LFVDDQLDCPPGWVQARNTSEAIALLQTGKVEEVSIDHDLGKGGKGVDVLRYIDEAVCKGDLTPPKITIHCEPDCPTCQVRFEAALRSISRGASQTVKPATSKISE